MKRRPEEQQYDDGWTFYRNLRRQFPRKSEVVDEEAERLLDVLRLGTRFEILTEVDQKAVNVLSMTPEANAALHALARMFTYVALEKAKHYYRHTFSRDLEMRELVNVAIESLYEDLPKYVCGPKESKFHLYLRAFIGNALMRFVLEKRYGGRMKKTRYEQIKRMENIQRTMRLKGLELSSSALAEILCLSEAELECLIEARENREAYSLDAPLNDESAREKFGSMYDGLPNRELSVEDQVVVDLMKKKLAQMPEAHRMLISMEYGLGDYEKEGEPYKRARILGMTELQMNRTKREAVSVLRGLKKPEDLHVEISDLPVDELRELFEQELAAALPRRFKPEGIPTAMEVFKKRKPYDKSVPPGLRAMGRMFTLSHERIRQIMEKIISVIREDEELSLMYRQIFGSPA